MEAITINPRSLADFYELYEEDYRAAELITKNIDELCIIYKNINLFQAVRRVPGIKIFMINTRARALYNNAHDAVLMFPDIHMSVVIPRSGVDTLASNIAWYNGPIMHLVRKTDMKQFTFICSDPAQVAAVLKYTHACFSDPSGPIYYTGNQVCVSHVAHRSNTEVMGGTPTWNTLKAYFARHATRASSEAIHHINSVTYDGVEYIRCQCNDINGLHLRT